MTYEEAVAFYHSLGRFGIRPGLEHISLLCSLLGDPQNDFAAVHVAGTNGKGSTCTEIASVLTAAGYKTGLYTSPYVIEFRERIRFCGEMIPCDELAEVTEIIRREVEKLREDGIYITEFEAVTAAAFLWYSRSGCEVAVLEVGLGGRFDATNIIRSPICSVITSISLDHINVLGNTVEEIAYEKCGIIKPQRPVITSGNQLPGVLDVIEERAKENGASLSVVPMEDIRVIECSITGSDIEYGGLRLKVPFCGDHQIENTSLVLETVRILRENGYAISDQALSLGLSRSVIPARTEIISEKPLVILDGSHNDGSTKALAQSLKSFLPSKRILAVMGMMADKDCESSVSNLLPFFSKVITVTPSNPRSMDSAEFASLIRAKGVEAQSVGDPVKGVALALAEADRYDAVVVCGSLYLAADVRSALLSLC